MLVVLGVGVGWEPSPLRTHTVLGAQCSAARLAGETCPVLRSAPPVHPAPPLHTASVRADTVDTDTLHPDHLLDGDTLAGVYRL